MRPQMVWLERYLRFMVEADISKWTRCLLNHHFCCTLMWCKY